MKSIRGGMGLGDALYVQSVARHLTEQGQKLRVHTAWPDVFAHLGTEIAPFSRQGIDILAHYSARKAIEGTTQFEDCCASAGISGRIDLRLDWMRPPQVTLPAHKPIVLVQLPRNPMGRTDGFGADLLPDCRQLQRAIDALRGRATLVQVGSGKRLFDFKHIDIDLVDKTTVPQLFDLTQQARALLGYCSFFVPLAESFDRPSLLIWSRRGLKSPHRYVRQITPEKILHKASSVAVLDDAHADAIEEAAHALLARN